MRIDPRPIPAAWWIIDPTIPAASWIIDPTIPAAMRIGPLPIPVVDHRPHDPRRVVGHDFALHNTPMNH